MITYEDAVKAKKTKTPVWWMMNGKPRKALITDVESDPRGGWCCFKLLCRGHRIEVEECDLQFLYKDRPSSNDQGDSQPPTKD